MAIEQFSENLNMSPRISFSYDLCTSDIIPIAKLPLRSNSSRYNSCTEFDFHVQDSFGQESSWADELFSNGRILPTEIKKKITRQKQGKQQSTSSSPPLPGLGAFLDGISTSQENPKKESSKEIKIVSETNEKPSSKSFWKFKRSNSVNCVGGYGRALCPLPLLTRSNSTGSALNVKQVPLSKDSYNHKQKIKPLQHSSSMCYHKPPLKKSTCRSYSNGVRVDPVLNVPSVNLFCLGSVFSAVKIKNKK